MSLFERLGGSEAITKISSDIVDLHLSNRSISNRFAKSDVNKLKKTDPHQQFWTLS